MEADAAPNQVTLEGTIAKIVYRNEDSQFAVARLLPAPQSTKTGQLASGLVTIVGQLVGMTEGSSWLVRGEWITDKKFGRQLKVGSAHPRAPETLDGIEKFLGSGLIPGIGGEMARRLVEAFGFQTLEVIGNQPARLTEVSGIGAARAASIAEAWQTHHHVQDVMVFLRGHGVSAAFAGRIIKQYGREAMAIVRANPYRLAIDIWGIGFRTADGIAQKMGLAKDAPARLEAGLLHVVGESLEDGHAHLPRAELLALGRELLVVEVDKLMPAMQTLVATKLLVEELLGDRGWCVSLPAAHEAEVAAAQAVAVLAHTATSRKAVDATEAIAAFEVGAGVELAGQQRRAVEAASNEKLVVITGGPGVGKTTIVKAICHLATKQFRRLALGAPTGRAALRLSESTGQSAATLHRLLEYTPQTGAFARNKDRPLEADVVIVDEASMIDIFVFAGLLAAIPPAAQLILVGDIDQLPSVGPGAILADVIASEAAVVVRLTEIFRQAAASQIVANAHRVNAGNMPEFVDPQTPGNDMYFINRPEPAAVLDTIVELVAHRIPGKFGFSPTADIQVLTPMHRGEVGTAALNKALQATLNPTATAKAELTRGDTTLRTADKVMQLKNDYDKGVFNGDIGYIDRIDADAGQARVIFTDGRIADYDRAELDQLALAYAVSVHKSQGSEYPAVVMPVVTQHFMMLSKSLLYTAMTRGKKLVILVGTGKAISLAVRNAQARPRHTYLAPRIAQAAAALLTSGVGAEPADVG